MSLRACGPQKLMKAVSVNRFVFSTGTATFDPVTHRTLLIIQPESSGATGLGGTLLLLIIQKIAGCTAPR
jgi:hypothetical protein